MRIAITGASGNIGTAVLRRLAGEHELVGIARRPPAARSDVEWHAIDLTRDAAVLPLRQAFTGADTVVHLAWGFQPSHAVTYLAELGIGGTRRVLRAVEEASVPHLVHFSSIGAYSPKEDDRPVREDWPTGGIPTSPYSRHKVTAERLLDAAEDAGTAPLLTRVRPALVGQRAAGSELLRYALPAFVPRQVLRHVPVLPLDRRLVVPMVHADDVAEAVARIIQRRATGAFNLAADPPLSAETIAETLGARLVQVPSSVLRALVAATWRARLQQVDEGWLDMAFGLPLLDATRARTELDWCPQVPATAVLAEVLEAMASGESGPSAVLRPRTVPGALADAVRRGPVYVRRQP